HIMFQIVNGKISPPSSRAPELPRELDAIVCRGLAKNAADRYDTARAMALALEAIAPAIRASEVAAWVQRVAAKGLDSRAKMLALVELTTISEAPSPPSVAPTGPKGRPTMEGTTFHLFRRLRSSHREPAGLDAAASDFGLPRRGVPLRVIGA